MGCFVNFKKMIDFKKMMDFKKIVNSKRVLGLVILVLGIACMFVSNYIKQQVAAGNMMIGNAQQKVARADQVLSLSPATKPLGSQLKETAHNKIEAGQQQITFYSSWAQWLQVGGIVIMVAGGVLVLFGTSSPKRRSR